MWEEKCMLLCLACSVLDLFESVVRHACYLDSFGLSWLALWIIGSQTNMDSFVSISLSQEWRNLCAIGILTSIEHLYSSNSDGFIVADGVHLVIIVSIVSRSWGDSKLNWLTRLRLHTILCHICTKLRPILSWYEWWWSQWGKQSLHWSLHRMVSFIAEAPVM